MSSGSVIGILSVMSNPLILIDPLLRKQGMKQRVRKIFRIFVRLAAVFLFLAACAEEPRGRLLFLGDSHSLSVFGETLDAYFRGKGMDTYTVVDHDAGPCHWLKDYQPLVSRSGFWEKSATFEQRIGSRRTVPKIEDLADGFQPDVIVIQTGHSLYGTLRSPRRSREENVKEVASLVTQMSKAVAKFGARAYWILPPRAHEQRYPVALQEDLATILTMVISKHGGHYFESLQSTRYDGNYPYDDGVTYSPEQSGEWARKVMADIDSFLASFQKQPTSPSPSAQPSPSQD